MRKNQAAAAVLTLVLFAPSTPNVSPFVPEVLAQASSPGGGWDLILPTRRVPDAPPAAPLALPAAARTITPSTLDVVVRREADGNRTRTLRQVVSRTVDTIHIAGSDRREWRFERNTIDPRRVSAAVVEHAAQTIVLYEESDLRMMFGIRGWADVLTLGFDSETLGRYKPTREARTIGGIRFSRRAATDRAGSASDVWWSDEHALPAEFATGDGPGSTRVLIERARAGVDPAVVAPAFSRFPKYRVVDLADWLEKH